MVHVDGAFRMGRAHLVCQDYVAVAAGEFPCVLLADGCSSSSDTDTGARLLVRSALTYVPCLAQASGVEDHFPAALNRYHQQAVCDARSHADRLHLDETALDATLLTLLVCGSQWFAAVFGDGVVVALNHAGEMEVTIVSYRSGYPNYPNYLADDARRKALLRHKANLRQVETFCIAENGGIRDRTCETFPADAPCPLIGGSSADYRWASALSDGVHTFYTVESATGISTPLSLETVLPELLAFKSFGGQFAQRRMQKFQQHCASRGWQHHDDVAMGVIVSAE